MILLNDIRPLAPAEAAAFGPVAAAAAAQRVERHPQYQPTPLVEDAALAESLGVAALHIKDESGRLGLNSFKALGGYHAISRMLEDSPSSDLTFVCASAGNHGRGVARAARLRGCQSVVYVSPGVSRARRELMEAEGARVEEVPGFYDDAVDAARRDSEAQGWTLLSDTAWPGYEHVPTLVMQGYLVLMVEALRQAPAPTHVFVQAGVGGLAGAVAGYLASVAPYCRVVAVQAARAASMIRSVESGAPLRIAAGERSSMSMLECLAPSLVGWRVLASRARSFVAVADAQAEAAEQELRASGLRSSPSGAAGFAGLRVLARDAAARAAIGLGKESRVMIINTEGLA